MTHLLLLVAYVLLSVFGLYWLKAAPTVISLPFAGGFAAYAAGFGIWLYMLMRLPLSVIFPIAAGSLIVGTQVVGLFFLDEKISPTHWVGVVLVLAGIGLIYARP
ncbi:MAG: hypothetical protein AB8G17_18880 [Gammaproteobacteria bacterium]